MYHFKGKISWFSISCHQHLKKVGTRPCLPLCGIPSSFYNSLQTSGDWGDKFSSLWIGMLSHSCLIQASSCSTVLGLLCRIFLFMMRQMFSMGERSGLQAGHFSTRILLLRSHDVVIDAVCGLEWMLECSDVGKCKVFPERDDVWMGAFVVLEFGYTFQHWWCLSRCVSCPCHTHSCNPIPSEMQASERSADNNLGCPCPI